MDSPRLSAGGLRFLDLHVPAVDFRLPSEDCRAYWMGIQTTTGLPRFAPVIYGRGGCFLYSGVHVSLHGTGGLPCHARSVKLLFFDPASPSKPSVAATFFDEASSEVNLCSPVRPSLRPVRLDGSGSSWASPLCCRMLRYLALAGVRDWPGHWLEHDHESRSLKLVQHRVATPPPNRTCGFHRIRLSSKSFITQGHRSLASGRCPGVLRLFAL